MIREKREQKKPEPQQWEATFTRTTVVYGSGLRINAYNCIAAVIESGSGSIGIIRFAL
jgi:hypothetical protein